MKEWKYNELTEAMKTNCYRFLSQNEGGNDAIVRTANEFTNMGKVEDVIVDVVIGELMIEQEVGIESYMNAIGQRLRVFDVTTAKDELTEEELKDLTHRIKNVLAGFKTLKVNSNKET